MSFKETLSDFILKYTPLENIEEDEDIFESGSVSSMFVMQLVTYVETTTGLVVQSSDLNFENFRSVAAIDTFVKSKTENIGEA